ncbi:MAG: glycoside hydrolase family 88 protein [Treponema sp.]|nr:glycoside hydrolase family 88 protein [Treponema sp.]
MIKGFPYFEEIFGLAVRTGDIKSQLEVIANRYIGANPALPYLLCTASGDFFKQTSGGDHIIDLNAKIGKGTSGKSLVCGFILSEIEKTIEIVINCFGPLTLHLNGDPVFVSDFSDEIISTQVNRITAVLKPGKNMLVLECFRTAGGFGCRLTLPQAVPVFAPFSSRNGMYGWVWTGLLDDEKKIDLPDADSDEKITGLIWYPNLEQPAGRTPQERIYSCGDGYCAAWSRVSSPGGLLKIESCGQNEIYLDSELVLRCREGEYTLKVPNCRDLSLHIKSTMKNGKGGLNISASNCRLDIPVPVSGTDSAFMYSGMFLAERPFSAAEFERTDKIYDGKYWRIDGNDLRLRPVFIGSYKDKWWVHEGGTSFGRWDYPLGVAMCGLLKVAGLLDRKDIFDYVSRHISACVDMYECAILDRDTYGFCNVDYFLTRLSVLDDCGSMGAAMLECCRIDKHSGFIEIADKIAGFIENRMNRLEDGTFYRLASSPGRSQTIWADDLYMSCSFLRRRYEICGDKTALDIAAEQFTKFKKYLFMPEKKLFSHVFDLTKNCQNGIPWGRGNGWTLFSLAEILEVMPVDYPQREQLLKLFRDLSEGLAVLQGINGLWHQVLDDQDSYEETSCTAMFVYAFCKGIKNSWYVDCQPYLDRARRGWNAITRYSVDCGGNIWAVCKGSGYSFTKSYYKNELFWAKNDNHGVGIVLLAGCELNLLEEILSERRHE